MTARRPRRERLRPAVFAVAAGVVAAIAVVVIGSRAESGPSAAMLEWSAVPDPVRPAFSPPAPRALAAGEVSSWAPVRRTVSAHAYPTASSPVVTTIETKTPEETDNLVLVLGRRADDAGRLWAKVRVPALPTNRTAWVPRSALGGYTVVNTHLKIDVERLTVTLFRSGRRVFEAPAGVGKPSWPTPKGHFYIRNKLTDFASPAYGPLAFGTSARSAVLTDWPGGGFIGIHGTDEPHLLPGRVSHGCVRLRNGDIVRLAELMPIGTPVTIS